jgi:glycosyltransferase involved in cell wall biosynthesis
VTLVAGERPKQSPRSKARAVRIAHLTSVHPHWDHRIFTKQCRTLADAGFDVTLIAPADQSMTIDGVRIRAVRPASTRVERLTRTVWRVYRAALQEQAELYHFHDPELIPIGFLLKLRGRRVVYDVHEDDPKQISAKSWLPAPLRGVVAWCTSVIEGVAARVFDATILVVPMRHRGFPRRKRVLVRNFPLPDEFPPLSGRPYPERAPLVAYVGGVSPDRGAREMLDALALVPRELGVRLAIGGWIRSADLSMELQAHPASDGVDFMGRLSRDQVAELLGRARVGICVLHPIPGFPESYPVKLFEYMAAGIPVIASDFPLWRRIIDGAGCGLLVNPLRPSELAEAIARLLRDPDTARSMGERGRAAVLDRYQWPSEANRLVNLYRRLLD